MGLFICTDFAVASHFQQYETSSFTPLLHNTVKLIGLWCSMRALMHLHSNLSGAGRDVLTPGASVTRFMIGTLLVFHEVALPYLLSIFYKH